MPYELKSGGRPRPLGLALLTLFALSLVVIIWVSGNGRFFFNETPSFDARAAINLFTSEPLRFDHWYLRDQARLGGLLNKGDDSGLRKRLRAELQLIEEEISELDAAPDFIHPDRGFRIYGPETTARLHVLGLAAEARRAILDGKGTSALLGRAALFTFAGYEAYPTRPSRFATVAEAAGALSQVDLPAAAFRGYRVYLLPYSMGAVGGAGGPGFSLIGAAPLAVQLVSEQVASTLTHEFGHHLSLSRMGGTYRDDPARWSRYMKMRGITRWRASGEVNTDDWALSPEETLAEDVRVLLGGPTARSLPFDASYRDPRSAPGMEKATVAFLRELAAAPVKTVDTKPVPWMDTPVPAKGIAAADDWTKRLLANLWEDLLRAVQRLVHL